MLPINIPPRVLVFILLTATLSSCVSKSYLLEKERLQLLQSADFSPEVLRSTREFAYEAITSCRDEIEWDRSGYRLAKDLVVHWALIQPDLIKQCEYSHRKGGHISGFTLDKIIRDSEGNSHYRYKVTFAPRNENIQVLVTRDAANDIYYLTTADWGKPLRLFWMVEGLVIE